MRSIPYQVSSLIFLYPFLLQLVWHLLHLSIFNSSSKFLEFLLKIFHDENLHCPWMTSLRHCKKSGNSSNPILLFHASSDKSGSCLFLISSSILSRPILFFKLGISDFFSQYRCPIVENDVSITRNRFGISKVEENFFGELNGPISLSRSLNGPK